MRFIQPMRATQLKIQASSAWPEHCGLVEDDVLDRVDARGDEGRSDGAGLPLQVLVDQLGGDRVHVDDAEDAVMLVLQRHELADGAKIVAQMQIAGRLDAGEDERLESGGHDVLPPGLWRARIPR
jgi:hypothetical protein